MREPRVDVKAPRVAREEEIAERLRQGGPTFVPFHGVITPFQARHTLFVCHGGLPLKVVQ